MPEANNPHLLVQVDDWAERLILLHVEIAHPDLKTIHSVESL